MAKARAKAASKPRSSTPAPNDLNGSQFCTDAQTDGAPVDLSRDHRRSDTHTSCVAADLNGSHLPSEAQRTTAPVDLHGGFVKLYADLVDDLEKTRTATENRVRSLIQIKGLHTGDPEEQRLTAIVKGAHSLENAAIRELERSVAAHPMGDWVKENAAIGLKSTGRLLGLIGDPVSYVDRETGEIHPRTVSKLWAYCGYAPDQKRRKGEVAGFNPLAKSRVYLLAWSCRMNRNSRFRDVYDKGREKYADRDISDGHKDSMAMRLVAKEILKDMWKFRRGQVTGDAQACAAPPEDLGEANRLAMPTDPAPRPSKSRRDHSRCETQVPTVPPKRKSKPRRDQGEPEAQKPRVPPRRKRKAAA